MADRATPTEVGMIGTAEARVDARISAMRQLLDTMADRSAAQALSALRDAFPDAPLHERVRAMKYSRH
jgi:hypothetical protein